MSQNNPSLLYVHSHAKVAAHHLPRLWCNTSSLDYGAHIASLDYEAHTASLYYGAHTTSPLWTMVHTPAPWTMVHTPPLWTMMHTQPPWSMALCSHCSLPIIFYFLTRSPSTVGCGDMHVMSALERLKQADDESRPAWTVL